MKKLYTGFSKRHYRALAVFTLILAFFLIIFGVKSISDHHHHRLIFAKDEAKNQFRHIAFMVGEALKEKKHEKKN